ncbi:MAG TPA: 4-(cytidine 5'-diphospho)-2-C-methyl-D-erythritol kinase [Bacteroidota bacterium]|nr:4-(cytidine 5'-diphospho)-2-C-methyl-D-erythritol kinase [Bacteroidota bacterium]
MVLQAYAKINLGLRIIERRPDGFHAIETIFHRISLADELTIEPTQRGISLSCTDPALPTDSGNLCWKAVACLQQECGTDRGASIHLYKRIPSGAGLGGGSSDAASILRTLPALWDCEISPERLNALGGSIGSDVPFFLQDSSAYAEGRGEQLTPFTLDVPYWILLVNPGIHVSTPWAYQEFSKKLSEGYRVPRGSLFSSATRRMQPLTEAMKNDFEDVVFPAYPAIRTLKQTLLEVGASHALMSGSGSSVFGLFENESAALRARARFAERMFTSLTEPHFIPA